MLTMTMRILMPRRMTKTVPKKKEMGSWEKAISKRPQDFPLLLFPRMDHSLVGGFNHSQSLEEIGFWSRNWCQVFLLHILQVCVE